MTKYRKPRKLNRVSIALITTSSIVLVLSLAGILTYYVITVGWEGIALWFTGKWFALTACIVIAVVFAIVAIVLLVLKHKAEEGDH